MKAMIFAAGEGRRMRPLTLATPKPLLKVGQCSLLEHQMRRLEAAGVREFVINVAYLADQVITALEQMDLHGLHVDVSVEESPLETGGALLRAQPYLGEAPFLLVNSDVWCDVDYGLLLQHQMAEGCLAHLVLVPNPLHNPKGDFVLSADGSVREPLEGGDASRYTFSGISVVDPRLISEYPECRERFPLVEALRHAMRAGRVSGEVFFGHWADIGTPERLEHLRERVFEG